MKHCLQLLVLFLLLSPIQLQAQIYDFVVAKDGTGDFTRIQDAVLAVRDYKPEGRQRILVKKGVYEEKLVIPACKENVALIGEDRDSTILIWHDHGNTVDTLMSELDDAGHKRKRNIGTFRSYTLLVNGPAFECENMTIVNDAMTFYNPNWNNDRQNKAGVAQAVAVHIEGDRTVFRNCRLLGFQDTVFNGNGDSRQLFWHCYIEGTVDFIFGPATVWFEECDIHAITQGYFTAASTPADHPYGYVFNRCRFSCDPSIKNEYLGRPWRNWAYVLLKECYLGEGISPKGWHNWGDPQREKTTRYYEYKCTGPSADRSQREAWTHEMSDSEAARITLENVFSQKAGLWMPKVQDIAFRDALAGFLPSGKYRSRYEAKTLEVEAREERSATQSTKVRMIVREPLVKAFALVDCVTLVEYVSAAILSREGVQENDSVYDRFLEGLRYFGGIRGDYGSRKHYTSAWIADNVAQGLLTDVTASLRGAKSRNVRLNFMTSHRKLYKQLADPKQFEAIQKQEKQYSGQATYLPASNIPAKVSADFAVEDGDIVCFETSVSGLDCSHMGFIAVADDGSIGVIHASSKANEVVVVPSLKDYAGKLGKCIGIRVLRLNR